jgi:guanylate kinase
MTIAAPAICGGGLFSHIAYGGSLAKALIHYSHQGAVSYQVYLDDGISADHQRHGAMGHSYKRLGLLFILMGPTGAGKNTLMNGVLDRLEDVHQLPTATTRAIRANEQEGREHHFVTLAEFERMIAADELLEWQNVHGRLYGVPQGTVEQAITAERDQIADIDVLGALLVRSLYPDNVVLIFVQPDEDQQVIQTVRERLQARGESVEEIENRLRRVTMEMQYLPFCDYLIVNNESPEQGIETLHSIIVAERARRNLYNARYQRGLARHRLDYRVTAILIHQGEAACYGGKLPTDRMLNGELPEEALHRLLAESLGIVIPEATPDKAPTHWSLEASPHRESLMFWVVRHLEQRPTLPEGWAWHLLSTLAIPEVIRNFPVSIA